MANTAEEDDDFVPISGWGCDLSAVAAADEELEFQLGTNLDFELESEGDEELERLEVGKGGEWLLMFLSFVVLVAGLQSKPTG